MTSRRWLVFSLCAALACSDSSNDDDSACSPSNVVDDAEIASARQSLSAGEQALVASALGPKSQGARTLAWSEAAESDKRAFVRDFVETVLIDSDVEAKARFVGSANVLRSSASAAALGDDDGEARYLALRRLLVAGDLVLARSQGEREGRALEFHDLFRVARGRIVEHWSAEGPSTPPSASAQRAL